MKNLLLKVVRYIQCYAQLSFGKRPKTLEETIDYCVNRPVLIGQVRSEILQLAKLLQEFAPKRSLEIGTNYGGTLFLLCNLSPPDASIISLDLPWGPFGGGYPRRKIPLFRCFPGPGQKLHLLRGDSHSPEMLQSVLKILAGDKLDYLFLDADHSYSGVRRDFETYSPLLRSGGIVVFHDIVEHGPALGCEVGKFWNEIKHRYRHLEIIETVNEGSQPTAVTGASMHTAGLGVLFMS